MSHKVVLIADPGIDGAFAISLALFDPNLEVLGLAATAGNVSAEQATKNMHILVEQLDPPRWPRLGESPAIEFDVDGTRLHGPNGLGNVTFPSAPLHRPPASEKLVVDLVKQNPREVIVVCMGPLTVLARALDLFPELPTTVQRLIVLGGTIHEPGNAGPVNEFHFFCDPVSARKVVHCGAPLTLVPLDAMRKVLFSPTDLLGLPKDSSRAAQFLRQIVPYGLAATANLYGIEGFYLKDVLGIVAVSLPQALRLKPMRMDVETRGELTRGMTVFDQRTWQENIPNVDVVHEVNGHAVREYISGILKLEE